MPIEHTLARRGAEKLWNLVNTEPFVNTLGALTGNQAMQQVKAGLKAIYLSGWQVAGDANIAGEMYPDQSLYPANSVPLVVKRINNTFTRADQIQWSEGKDDIDYFAPIVADAEAGFGGVLNAFELMKSMIEAGAAGVHFEDQLASVKKCGHMGGKVLVPTREAVAKLDRRAARRRRDGRADAGHRPHRRRGRRPGDQRRRRQRQAVPHRRAHRRGLLPHARPASTRRSRAAWPTRRTPTWCGARPASPTSAYAKAFAEAIHKKFPGKLLAYNCSPSFNWKKNLDDATIAKFQRELGAMGYKFQFITLAGFHSLNYSMFNLAHGYARNNMTRVRRAAGGRVRRGREGLHRGQAPARGRHRLLRRGDDDDRARRVDRRAEGLDRGRAVLRPQARLTPARRRADGRAPLLLRPPLASGDLPCGARWQRRTFDWPAPCRWLRRRRARAMTTHSSDSSSQKQ